jgi:hypothetical protein
MNATPRLSGLQKSHCLPGSAGFSGRQASCRLPSCWRRGSLRSPSPWRRDCEDNALLLSEGAGVTPERRSSSNRAATRALELAPARLQERQRLALAGQHESRVRASTCGAASSVPTSYPSSCQSANSEPTDNGGRTATAWLVSRLGNCDTSLVLLVETRMHRRASMMAEPGGPTWAAMGLEARPCSRPGFAQSQRNSQSAGTPARTA